MKEHKKLVVFGAGKIGRSFIGQLFSLGGYEVVFIDIYQPIITELNRRHNYNVIIKGDKDEILNIKNVKGVNAGNIPEAIKEIAGADILAVSVGQNGLPEIMPLLAKGLMERFKQDKDKALDIIIAENMRNAAEFFRDELMKLLPEEFPLDRLIGLVETSIGKMVPIMLKKDFQEDLLQVFAEPYNTLILDKLAFKNPIPAIKGLAPKENMKAWVDRKLFIHNLGHAVTAYLGYLHDPNFTFLHEALSVPEVYNQTRMTMLQSADILMKKYPGEFTKHQLIEHINDLLNRFQNKALGDTIFRVGCDLMRKFGPEDRLAGAIMLAYELGLPYNLILYALVCGCYFHKTDEENKMHPSDNEFLNLFMQQGIRTILLSVCRFHETQHRQIIQDAILIDREITQHLNRLSDQ